MKRRDEGKNIQNLKHHARRLSIKEGVFASVKSSLGDSYLTPFAIAINVSNPFVVLINSFPGLIGPIIQIISSRVMGKYSRKRIVLTAVFLEMLIWIPFILLAVLFYFGILNNFLPIFLFLFYFSYVVIANFITPAWFSWVGDLVDQNYRGRWFAKRHLITGFVAGVLSIFGALFLDFVNNRNLLMFGFIILFSAAALSRFFSFLVLRKQYEPKLKAIKEKFPSFFEFFRERENINFRRFSIFRALLSFSVAISSSLVAIYLLRGLNFNYFVYILIIFSAGGFSLIFLNFWGHIGDRFGNYRVLVLSSILLPTVPLFWILNQSPIYLIFVPSLIEGISWSGFNLATSNFIYDNFKKEKRGIAISYFNLLIGLGSFLGGTVGAILMWVFSLDLLTLVVVIFFLSAVLRMIFVFYFVPQIIEKRIQKFKSIKNFKKFIFREFKSSLTEEFHQIASIKHYLEEK